jgi:hypothetical protein
LPIGLKRLLNEAAPKAILMTLYQNVMLKVNRKSQ